MVNKSDLHDIIERLDRIEDKIDRKIDAIDGRLREVEKSQSTTKSMAIGLITLLAGGLVEVLHSVFIR